MRQMPYGAAGDILIDFPGTRAPLAYEHGLDLHQAIQRTSYRNGQRRFEREVFVSPVDQVLVVRFTATGGGKLDLDIGYRHPGPAQYWLVRYDGGSGELRAAGASWGPPRASTDR